MTSRRTFLTGAVATGAVSLAPGPRRRTAAAQEAPRTGGILKVAIIGEPPSLDAHFTTASLTYDVTSHFCEPLFTLDDKYAVVPMLAEGYTVGEGGRVYTIRLRRGVPFHNGKELSAEDVVASLGRWGKMASVGKLLFKSVQSIQAKDRHTVELRLATPSGIVLSALANASQFPAIYPKEVVEAAGDGQIKEFIGTGPFRFVERIPDRYVRMARFDRYAARSEPPSGYGGKRTAYVDEIQFIPVPDVATRAAGVESGEYHFSDWIAPDSYDRLSANPRLDVMVVKPNEWITGVFNKKIGPFTNRTLRQAVMSALDMEPIMKAAVGRPEFYRLDSSIQFREQVWWTDVGKEAYNRPDKARAKRLMQEAGYKGEPIRWMCTQFYDWMYKSALAAKQQLEDVGFVIDLQVLEWATVVQRRSDPRHYEIFTTGVGFAADPTFQVILSCDWPGWTCDPKLEAMMGRLASETDTPKRMAIWRDIQGWFWQEVPVIKFGDFFTLRIKQKAVGGYANRYRPFFWNVWLAAR
ncbi:MAG TPA: ABC transporter substrate-binding protein [Methylomirabilota bacterium]|jgi:peptide/nickel transport system substrate-binding protein|nr:ABC transporter substrate-binding protein [Methylomirabilota bacterium]